jgi:hypothetical protein
MIHEWMTYACLYVWENEPKCMNVGFTSCHKPSPSHHHFVFLGEISTIPSRLWRWPTFLGMVWSKNSSWRADLRYKNQGLGCGRCRAWVWLLGLPKPRTAMTSFLFWCMPALTKGV